MPAELPAVVVQALLEGGLTVATAESLTAGLLAATLADVPGASGTLQGGVVAYQNHAKEQVLGVDGDLLARRGAVDGDVAVQMAQGARRVLGADVGLATTGVAGPEPHQGKPVGTVHLGISGLGEDRSLLLRLEGDRPTIRRATVELMLEHLQDLLSRHIPPADSRGLDLSGDHLAEGERR